MLTTKKRHQRNIIRSGMQAVIPCFYMVLLIGIYLPKNCYCSISITHDTDLNHPSIVDTIQVSTRYKNGIIKDCGRILKTREGRFIKDGTWKSYYENGRIKDSAFYNGKQLRGEYKKWYKNGKLMIRVIRSLYGADSLMLEKFYRFDINGDLRIEGSLLGNKVFGNYKWYKNGNMTDWKEFNKGREVTLPSEFKTSHDFIRDSLERYILYSGICVEERT